MRSFNLSHPHILHPCVVSHEYAALLWACWAGLTNLCSFLLEAKKERKKNFQKHHQDWMEWKWNENEEKWAKKKEMKIYSPCLQDFFPACCWFFFSTRVFFLVFFMLLLDSLQMYDDGLNELLFLVLQSKINAYNDERLLRDWSE